MLNPAERHEWFMCFLDNAMSHPEARVNMLRAVAWARSMSLIAEQFVENDEDDE